MGISGSKLISTRRTLPNCTLWKADRSPACRSVMMALDAMDISITEVDVNMDKGEHRNPTISAMNPLKTLPILQHKKLILHDSHAINSYLAAFSHINRILPQDPDGHGLTNQIMHYDSGVLQPMYRAAAYPLLYENYQYVMPEQVSCIENAYQNLENMLAGRSWFGGTSMTLGDIAVAASLSTLNIMVPMDKLKFPLLSGWLFRMTEQPFYITANYKGLLDFARSIQSNQTAMPVSQFQNCPRTSITRRSTGGRLSEK